MTRRAVTSLALAAALAAGCGGRDDGPGPDGSGRAAAHASTTPATGTTGAGEPGPAATARDRGPITAAGVSEHLRALQRIADRSGGNRAAGTRGDRETADYVAARLRTLGWHVRTEDVTFPFFRRRGRPVLADLRHRRDFSVLEYSPGGDVRARVRPLDTQACEAAALTPVRRGEILLVARGSCTFRRKARNAQRAGAAALVVADQGASEPASGTLARPHGIDIPVVAVTGAAAARLARADAPVRLKVDTVSEQRRTRNVIADSPGTAAAGRGVAGADAGATGEAAPTRRIVMAGAHLDSVEEGPGINDDGSGVAALLEVAERVADRPGVRLGFWAAEELGLYGSRRHVRELTRAERRRIAVYLNLDMVGSPRPRPMVYDTDDVIEQTLRRALPGAEGEIDLGASSDHTPFQRAGIPVGGLFTGASARTDPCYHRACDTVRSADAAMTARMAEATATALRRLHR
jgi:hypothetical protein